MNSSCAMLAILALAAVPLPADEPPVAPRTKTVKSPNGKFYARLEYPKKVTTVFTAKGEKLWSMDGWFPVVFLSNSGEYLAVGNDGNNLVPRNHSSKEVMVRFFRFGQPTGRVTLDQVVRDMKSLQRTVSHCAWGMHIGFDDKGRYVMETVEKRTVMFDPATARILAQ